MILLINLSMYFGCLKELSHCGGSFENAQHRFMLRKKVWRHEYINYYLGTSVQKRISKRGLSHFRWNQAGSLKNVCVIYRK